MLIKKIPGTNYFASNKGAIFGPLSPGGLRASVDKRGYMHVCIYIDGKKRTKFVHRLVMSAFSPINNMNCFVVDHIDDDPLNNNIKNLRWATIAQNIQFKVDKKRHAHGDSSGVRKLNQKNVLKILAAHSMNGFDAKKMATMFGVTAGTIHKIVNKKSWVHIK